MQNSKEMGHTQMSVLVTIQGVCCGENVMEQSGNNNWKLNKSLITKDFEYSVKDFNAYIIHLEFLLSA